MPEYAGRLLVAITRNWWDSFQSHSVPRPGPKRPLTCFPRRRPGALLKNSPFFIFSFFNAEILIFLRYFPAPTSTASRRRGAGFPLVPESLMADKDIYRPPE
jgi:hypothetical protein